MNKNVIGEKYHIDLSINFFDEKNASIEIVDQSEQQSKHFGELLLFGSFTLRQMHNLGLSNIVSVSMAEVLAFCGNPTKPLTLLVGPHELSLSCMSSEHLRQNKHFTKRVFSDPIYTGVYTLSRRA